MVMKRFRVQLETVAVVRQIHEVDAENAVEAAKIAESRCNDEVWTYRSLDSGPIESTILDETPQG